MAVVDLALEMYDFIQVHPIFVLAIVDALLSLLWISGSVVWLRGGDRGPNHPRAGCFTVNLMTVVSVMFCDVVFFLTVSIKKTTLLLVLADSSVCGNECNPNLCSTGILQYQTERLQWCLCKQRHK